VANQTNKRPKQPSKQSFSNIFRRVLFTFFVICLCFGLVATIAPSTTPEQVAISDVIARANDENGDIKKITVSGNILYITLKDNDQPTQISRKDSSGTLYDQGLINKCADLTGDELTACEEKYPVIEYVEPDTFWETVADIAVLVIPVIILAAFFIYMMRQAQSINKESMGFGKVQGSSVWSG